MAKKSTDLNLKTSANVESHDVKWQKMFFRSWNLYETLNSFFASFLGERSEACSHKDTSKMISFFPVRDIPMRFTSLKLIGSAPIGRIYPIFVWTLQRVFDLSFSQLWASANFLNELLAKTISNLRIFYSTKAIFFSPVSTIILEMLIFSN